MTRILLCLTVFLGLAACAARGVITLVPGALIEGAVEQRVFVASNRLSGQAENGALLFFDQTFGDVRDATLKFGRVTLSIPPTHRVGVIEWPLGAEPDPMRHFLAVDELRYGSDAAFLRDVKGAARGEGVTIFVHGFNVNNAEAVYRLAQIAHDFGAREPVVAFSWPSAGSPRGYVYDRDSVMFSRDDLEEVLTLFAREGVPMTIVAHSMGSQLVMETLRQLSISGKRDVLRRIETVALISPDIDADVFAQQAARIAPFPEPFTILVSARDRALSLSAFLTGKPTRLGSITDPAELVDLPVDVVDLSDVEGGDRSGHLTAFTSPEAIRLLREMGADDF
jgi:esterase/lipase superfamily enzyme